MPSNDATSTVALDVSALRIGRGAATRSANGCCQPCEARCSYDTLFASSHHTRRVIDMVGVCAPLSVLIPRLSTASTAEEMPLAILCS